MHGYYDYDLGRYVICDTYEDIARQDPQEGVPSMTPTQPGESVGVKDIGWIGDPLYSFPAGSTDKYVAPTYPDGPPVPTNWLADAFGYEVDYDLLKQWLWEDRMLIAGSVALGLGAYSVIQEPERYGPPIAQLFSALAEAIKGIGEVIPG